MNKRTRFFTVTLVFALLCGALAAKVSAKWLEECDLCGGTGDYHCASCGNTGAVTCQKCDGTGIWTCPGEDGKGKCDNGYYTCPSCHGTGYATNEYGEVDYDRPCGYQFCNGTGRIECWTCHGTPTRPCDRCNGTGMEECQTETCKVSRAYGWKCPDCKGTGYTLLAIPVPPKSANTGANNVPEPGDWIFTDQNGTYYVYGGGSAGAQAQTDSGANAGADAQRETKADAQSGTGSAKADTRAETAPETGETAPEEFSGEQQGDEPETDQAEAGDDGLELVPENRDVDFDLPLDAVSSSVRVEVGRMTDSERRYYDGLPAEELSRILDNVRMIVASAEPGRSDADTLLSTIAAQNGFDDLRDGRIFPLYFEGHQEIGFPVRVTVSIEQGDLDGGTELYVYHIAEGGAIDCLGKAEYITYRDGSIESISFYTSSFSTFFTAAKELTLTADGQSEAVEPILTTDAVSNRSAAPVLAGAIAVGAAALAVVVIVVVKKRGKPSK